MIYKPLRETGLKVAMLEKYRNSDIIIYKPLRNTGLEGAHMKLRLYHGSENIIEVPEYGKGMRNNDYGRGFYCTEDIELAREWACAKIMTDM